MTEEEIAAEVASWRAAPDGSWKRAMFEALLRRSGSAGQEVWEVRAKRYPMGWLYYPCRVNTHRWSYLRDWRRMYEAVNR